ncbi:hypothetical protein BCV69DRAFT_309414 [Microstroma glucosiphilum]|uniref:phosphatidylinositol-3,4,5-trisphosphate 3-phosphatase n=1 Tax=Pseudomicrostroma glucosiphilum TaxID=1684307 RepID=A0A316UE89_9BASI|nr:hypothetical protein BCV69DRAFT_309414 [Pseudomicrostroma glucosiphilum]PWN23520.1 hypothetical protein BCV69DRAFT_309414 [Pseudomicrostroma glucosiphilum]
MSLHLKRLVSGGQARFVQDGVDLDLVYITDRLLIMAFPSTGVPTVWRNNRHEVRRFLDERHGKGWRVWNFRPKDEGEYDEEDFYGRVSRYPFPDHQPPPLSLIPMAVADMTAWLAEDPKNVIVIHCKAGKGRSGTMACSYLISLPKLPLPPRELRNISIAKHKTKSGQDIPTGGLAQNALFDSPAEDAKSGASAQAITSNEYDPSVWRSKIEAALALHSSQRMKPKAASAGPLAVSMNTVSSANYANAQAADGLTSHADLQRPKSMALGLTPGGKISHVQSVSVDAGRRLAQSEGFAANGGDASPDATTSPNSRGEHASLDTTSQAPYQSQDENDDHKSPSLVGRVGVSIASQRRWMGYWARLLAQQDARASLTHLAPAQSSRVIRILRISILQDLKTSADTSSVDSTNGASHATPGGGHRSAISAARHFGKLDSFKLFVGQYDTALVTQLEDFERDARRRQSVKNSGSSDSRDATGGPAIGDSNDVGKGSAAQSSSKRLAQHGNEEGVGQWGFDVVTEAEKARRFHWPDTPSSGGSGRKFDFFDWFAKLKESERVVGGGEEAGEEGHSTDTVWHHFDLDPTSSNASSKANLASLSKAPSAASPPSPSHSPSSSASQGLLVSPDRELCLRVQSRNKVLNALLPDIASSAGWVWLIPAFEEPRSAGEIRRGDRTTVRFAREEVDFAKKITGLRGVQVEWEWVSTGNQS